MNSHNYTKLKKKSGGGDGPKLPPELLKKMDNHIGIIKTISGTTANGRDFYAYVAVKPSLYEEFERKLTTGEKMDVDSYGKVLHKGFGKAPSDDVKRFMEEQYGIDHNFGADLAEAVRKELEKRAEETK